MAILGKADILSAEDRKTVDVDVDEWGGTVRLREMSGRERDKFESDFVQTKGGETVENYDNLRARLVAACAVDENLNKLFPKAEDVKALGNKSASALNKVWKAAQKLNGMTEADVEELVEDLKADPSDDSTSA